MTEEEITSLLGRKLSSIESDNFDMYLEVAKDELGSLLCMDIVEADLDAGSSPRPFSPRPGYRTLYVDPFVDVSELDLNGEPQDFGVVLKKQFEHSVGSWFNVFEFPEPMKEDDEIVVVATWGMNPLPNSLKLLLARMFGSISKDQSRRVKSKTNEGFSVTYSDVSEVTQFALDNAPLINKYSMCGKRDVILHGKVYEEWTDEYL